MPIEITSRQNLIYKELKRISKGDDKYIFIEGAKLLEEALTSPIKIRNIYLDKQNKSLLGKPPCKNGSQKLRFIKNELISSLYTTDTKPTKEDLLITIAERPRCIVNDLLSTGKNLILLEGIQDPGNLGTILRSALAFNAGGVILTKGSVDPFNTKVIRSSTGAAFKLPVIIIDGFNSVKKLVKENNYAVIATSSRANKTLSNLENKEPYLFLFGNEGSGLSKTFLNEADEIIKIPHTEMVESLNLGIAVSILLWQVYYQLTTA